MYGGPLVCCTMFSAMISQGRRGSTGLPESLECLKARSAPVDKSTSPNKYDGCFNSPCRLSLALLFMLDDLCQSERNGRSRSRMVFTSELGLIQ